MNQRVTSPWKGVLLCAGLGTRLRPLTDFIPKPLMPIGDSPMASFAARSLVAGGASELSLNAFHLAPHVQAFARSLSNELSRRVECHVESELLGTAGGIAAAARDTRLLVVWNGDIFAPDLSLDWVNEQSTEVPTLVVSNARAKQRESAHATIGLGAKGEVVRVRGERFGDEVSAADYIGVAVLPPAFTASLPRRGCLVADALLPWLRAGKRVSSYQFEGHWSDGGTLGEYWQQNAYWLQRMGLANYVAVSAHCAPSVALSGSIVGQAAQVTGSGLLRRTLVLPGARATAPLSDAIVAPNGQVIHVTNGGA